MINMIKTGERRLTKNDRFAFARAQARKEERRQIAAIERRESAPSNAVAWTNGQFFVPRECGVMRIK